ncbi:phosphonate ABC transporter permease [Candidimonas nitroreducens]|uniref:Phosphonate ABC transporter permease n=1 Tax=Candidimonas nitroreducens TaxID=683354 RepID=A0A225MXF2_9BURK|nr:phosphonate ABC transporter permease [Candidimonas nitroreducens]
MAPPFRRIGSAPALLAILAAFLMLFSMLPLVVIFWKSLQSTDGAFVGLSNYRNYFADGSAYHIITNTLTIAVVSSALTIVLAYLFALCLTHTCVRFKPVFRGAALLPLLTPTLLSAMALTQLFGTQGYLHGLMMGQSIYGPIGIIISMVVSRFPHVFILISTAIALSDSRLYEAAKSLKAGPVKTFLTITLPSTRYGVLSSAIVCFTLCVTDFAIPKVIGGQYAMLATEIYKQVVGQMNFQMGAVVSIIMLAPTLIAFLVDRHARKRQQASLTAKSIPYTPRPNAWRDGLALAYCVVITVAMAAMIAIPAYASFIKFWPYNLSFTLRNYHFGQFDGAGWQSYFNSLRLAIAVATVGTVLTFAGAWLVEKSTAPRWMRDTYQSMTLLPLAVPGLVLGLATLLYLSEPRNPFGFLYGTMSILVITTIIHYYTVSHFTATTSLRQLDPEFELISDSMKASRLKVLLSVTLPLCIPALLDIWIYLFLSAMNTVSAAIFLYSTDTIVASVAVVNMDDAGSYAPAAAMATTMVATCIALRILHIVASSAISRKTQKWRAT